MKDRNTQPQHDTPRCCEPDCNGAMAPAAYQDGIAASPRELFVGMARLWARLSCVECGHARTGCIDEVLQAWYAAGAREQRRWMATDAEIGGAG